MSARVGPVAQRLEQRTHNPLVLGSNPSGPTKNPYELIVQSGEFWVSDNFSSDLKTRLELDPRFD